MENSKDFCPSGAKYATIGFFKNKMVKPVQAKTISIMITSDDDTFHFRSKVSKQDIFSLPSLL